MDTGRDHSLSASRSDRKPSSGRSATTARRKLAWTRRVGLGAALAVLFMFANPVLAVHDLGIFELDGNATNSIAAGDDWDQVYAGTSSAAAAVFVPDGDDFSGGVTVPAGLPTDDTSYFTTGGSKDVNDINQWRHQTGDVAPDKDEILNAYAAAYLDGTDVILYFGLDRFANNGDAQVGFWFFQSNHSLNPDGTFSGVHEVGDILVLSHFTQGGVVDTIQIYKWVGPPDADNLALIDSGIECGPPLDDVCAIVNHDTEDAPWPYVAKAPEKGESANDFAPSSFYEGGVTVTAEGLDIGCGGSFLAETRSSQALDAQLKDFALGAFSLCGIDVTKEGPELSKVGDGADYTITIENTGAIALFKESIIDDVFGDITDGVGLHPAVSNYVSNCGATLAPGASCTITLTYEVQPGDPDPLENTVTATYNNEADFSGTDVSDFASHSVNLFQPSIAVDKTGDTLSKVGDTVTYTFQITNTSSADSPDLIMDSITDTLLGDLAGQAPAACDQLAPGASCSFNVDRVVQAGDPDPLLNTVTVHYHPEGFPNHIFDSDDHSVNLFQPAIAVDKTGDTLSKVGDDVNYVITLSNNSSADTPALSCTATDSLLGEVFNGVLPLGDTVINRSRTVQAGDPDPLVNTVSMTCSVAGFPNVLGPVSDSHTTELFQPAVEVIKTSPASAAVGETITYTFTINNLSSGDSPNLILDGVTDTVLGDLTATANANGCGTLASPGGSCTFTFDYTIQSTDPNPLVNVVTVHYHPAGFPNDITDSDDHSVEIVANQGCTPGFWQGGVGSQLWDEPNDPQWIYNGTNPFTHDTLFNAFFNNGPTDPRLDGYTMFQLVSTGGGSNWAVKAARDMVAAYLNESAFPATFPAASLDALEDLWYDAVAGGDAGLQAFHNLVSGWNSPEEPGFCPLP